MRNVLFRGTSLIFLAVGAGGLVSAAAQTPELSPGITQDLTADCDPDSPGVQTECSGGGDRVVVTGSNIAGASESAALPVEVFTADDLYKEGGQSALEFAKSLTAVGSITGDSNQFQGTHPNITVSNLNLRGLGGGRTLTIFNGRRFSSNINMIPQIALARTEILKDGGAVIYGADATGGVVNFITRNDFEGVLLDAQFKGIEGTKGDYGLAALWGASFGQANLMVAAEYSHRSELDMKDRDWAVRERSENPVPWAPYHTLGSWRLMSPTDASLGIVSDFTASDCENSSGPVRGVPGVQTGVPVCNWNFPLHTYNLVESQDHVRLYGQLVADLTDTLRFTTTLAYGKSTADEIGTVSTFAAQNGPGPTTGTSYQFRIPRSNPYFNSFLAQNASQVSSTVLPQIAAADMFLSGFFGPGGAPNWAPGKGMTPTSQLENWNAVAALDGEFGDFGGGWLDTWKLSATYNLATSDSTLPDIVGYRVQQALNGFGGPNCNAPDLVPDRFDTAGLDANGNGVVSPSEYYAVVGTQNPAAAGKNGCLYLNPFSSSYAGNAVFGQPNPRHIPGNEVPAELAAWLFDERQSESTSSAFTIDALMTGNAPLALPGGEVGWALGAQWRQSENRVSTSSEFNRREVFPCAWPGEKIGDYSCPAFQGPYFFFQPIIQGKTDEQQYSYFGELQVPVVDRFSLQLAVRREEFPRSGLGATVYKVAGKWEPFAWLAVRGSFGTNYTTPPNNIAPGTVTTSLQLLTNAGNRYRVVESEVLSGIKPETAEVGNFGVIMDFASGLPLDGALRLSLDYFDFNIVEEIKQVNPNSIVNSVVTSSTAFVNCSAPLVGRVSFINGVGAAGCTQGVTTGNDITGVRTVQGNGPGIRTSGVDIDVSYSFALVGGDATLGFTGTNILSYDIDAFSFNGQVLSPAIDALGYANYSRDGDLVSEWRANTSANYAIGDHNVRYVLRYIQGVEDDRQALTSPFRQIDDYVTHNLYYQYTAPWDKEMTFSFSIQNLTDQDPPFTQQQYSYDPYLGDPLGRTFEVGIRKRF